MQDCTPPIPVSRSSQTWTREDREDNFCIVRVGFCQIKSKSAYEEPNRETTSVCELVQVRVCFGLATGAGGGQARGSKPLVTRAL